MILVTGGTGHVGKELIPQLLETGQSIRVFVRDERKVAHLDASFERARWTTCQALERVDAFQA